MRDMALWVLVSILSAGCVLGGKEANNTGEPDAQMSDVADANDTADDGTPDLSTPDQGRSDLGRPDLGGPDMGVPDVGAPDMAPDMPSDRPASAVCDGTPPSLVTGTSLFRLRVASTDARVFGGWVRPNRDAQLLAQFWSQWDLGPTWVGAASQADQILNNPEELEAANITGVAVLPIAGTGFTDILVTRTPDVGTECLYGEFGAVNQTFDCAGAWGAEATNTAGTPRYFWFGENGTIGSTPVDDFDPMSQQFVVPWCASDPADTAACLPVSFRATDARGNRGPNVLLSDAEGRAYLWDSVQSIDGSAEAIDCTVPPTAPVPMYLQGNPVMFQNADVVRLDDGTQYLVHQTDALVSVHPLDGNFQPAAAIETLPNAGLRPHFDATSDGTRIAAVTAANAALRLFAFGQGGSTLDEVVDNDANYVIQGIGVTILDDKVAVIAGQDVGSPFGNAFTMWGN